MGGFSFQYVGFVRGTFVDGTLVSQLFLRYIGYWRHLGHPVIKLAGNVMLSEEMEHGSFFGRSIAAHGVQKTNARIQIDFVGGNVPAFVIVEFFEFFTHIKRPFFVVFVEGILQEVLVSNRQFGVHHQTVDTQQLKIREPENEYFRTECRENEANRRRREHVVIIIIEYATRWSFNFITNIQKFGVT